MAEKDEKPDKGFTSTAEGVESNHEVTEQTPDQFFDPAAEEAKREADPPKNHATKGMTVLGYTEASRIENTMEAEERERARVAKLAKKES